MKYTRYTIETTTEAEDVIVSALYDLGIEGVEIEDKIPLSEAEKAGMFVDIPPETGEDDGVAYLRFYLEPPSGKEGDTEKEREALLQAVKEELRDISGYMDAGTLAITEEELADQDYLNNWKQFFHQFMIDDILFIPSWEEEEALKKDGKTLPPLTIRIDPGSAFGTGKHETTRLCIQSLRKVLKTGDRVLDIGTGSGILSLMAYKFGASSVIGTDLDPAAVPACRENLNKNGVAMKGVYQPVCGDPPAERAPGNAFQFIPDKTEILEIEKGSWEQTDDKSTNAAPFELILGNLIDDRRVQDLVGYGRYDVVLANILAEVLIPLIPKIKKALKPGGHCILSGIIGEKEEPVTECLQENGFTIQEISYLGTEPEKDAALPQDRWVGITAQEA
ncbi:MAG: 50S ribosomal protein L11 methyltransferase [Lachnospiraceae bacterium]|nr:50S ribosomal protein L11 methyltransferase [Lachnospiraceae bacterium]